MARSLKLIIALGLFVVVLTENSHLKELDFEENDYLFMNLFNDEEIQANERYARHIKAVTENAVDHLVNEIRHEYFKSNYHSNSPLRKFMRKINEEVKKKKRNKLNKDKQKQNVQNKRTESNKLPNKKKKKSLKKGKKTPNTYIG